MKILIPCPHCHKPKMIKTFFTQGKEFIMIIAKGRCYKCGKIFSRNLRKRYQTPRKCIIEPEKKIA